MIVLAILAAVLAIAAGIGWGLAIALIQDRPYQQREITELRDRLSAGSLAEYKATVAMPASEPLDLRVWYPDVAGTGLYADVDD